MLVFSDFFPGVFADAPPITQNKTVSKVNFSIIHLVRTVCELTSSIRRTTLRQLYFVYICSRSKTAEHFLQTQCTVCADFADADTSFLEQLLSGRNLFPWFRAFFLLFVGFVHPLITNSFEFKPTISEDGYLL